MYTIIYDNAQKFEKVAYIIHATVAGADFRGRPISMTYLVSLLLQIRAPSLRPIQPSI